MSSRRLQPHRQLKWSLLGVAGLAAGLAATIAPIVSAQTSEQSIAFGTKHGVVLRTNGDVLTWGNNVFCALGRATSVNSSATPDLVLRNAKEIAVASSHNLALTVDGKVYAWGGSDGGALGTGDENEQCEGPFLVPSLADKTIVHIATGANFSLAVTSAGDLYCTGENDMGQCPAAKNGKSVRFVLVPMPELAGQVSTVRAGSFHGLALTKDGKLYAFGRGRDGQLGNGRMANGFALVPELTDVVSFAAGTWHSAATRADGSLWLWGSNSKAQLCDGTTTNRAAPTKVEMAPAGLRITHVKAGGYTTFFRTSDGALYACGDNQFAAIGTDKPPVVPRPVLIASATHASVLAVSPGASAYSIDGCAVRIGGYNQDGVVSASGTPGATAFAVRTGLSLCAPRPATPLPTIVREWPHGGASGCWTPRVEEDASTNAKWAPQRQAMLAAEALLRRNTAYLSTPVPVRFRTSLSAGPYNESGARMHIKAAPERKMDGTRLWTGECDVIPQIDRIGGAIGQISVFFNNDARGMFVGPTGEGPKLTGKVAGYPRYNKWILIARDGRLPWIPQTLSDKLDAEGSRRRDALAAWKKSRADVRIQDAVSIQKTYDMLKKNDPAGAESYLAAMKAQAEEIARLQQQVYPATTAELEKQVSDFETYRASFTPDELRAPAVFGDPSGEGKRRLDAQIASLHALTPDEQRQADEWGRDSRAFERQAQVEATKNSNPAEAARLRTQSNDLAMKVRTLRERHIERIGPHIEDANAEYRLKNLRPGTADKAISFKSDPTFPDLSDPNRIQVIAILFSEDPDPRQTARRAWQQQTKDTFDFAALAALLK